MQLLDLPWEKSRKMKRGGESVPGSEVKIFKGLFIADLKSDGRKNKWGERCDQGKRASGRNITGGSFKVVFKSSRLSSSHISKKLSDTR